MYNVFVLLITLLVQGPDNTTAGLIQTAPFQTEAQCQAAIKTLVKQVATENPPTLLGYTAQCIDGTVKLRGQASASIAP